MGYKAGSRKQSYRAKVRTKRKPQRSMVSLDEAVPTLEGWTGGSNHPHGEALPQEQAEPPATGQASRPTRAPCRGEIWAEGT